MFPKPFVARNRCNRKIISIDSLSVDVFRERYLNVFKQILPICPHQRAFSFSIFPSAKHIRSKLFSVYTLFTQANSFFFNNYSNLKWTQENLKRSIKL